MKRFRVKKKRNKTLIVDKTNTCYEFMSKSKLEHYGLTINDIVISLQYIVNDKSISYKKSFDNKGFYISFQKEKPLSKTTAIAQSRLLKCYKPHSSLNEAIAICRNNIKLNRLLDYTIQNIKDDYVEVEQRKLRKFTNLISSQSQYT